MSFFSTIAHETSSQVPRRATQYIMADQPEAAAQGPDLESPARADRNSKPGSPKSPAGSPKAGATPADPADPDAEEANPAATIEVDEGVT